jgi:hypothetical protein
MRIRRNRERGEGRGERGRIGKICLDSSEF